MNSQKRSRLGSMIFNVIALLLIATAVGYAGSAANVYSGSMITTGGKVAAVSRPAYADTENQPFSMTADGRIRALTDDNIVLGTAAANSTGVTLAAPGNSTVLVDVRGTWVGTLTFQGTVDGTNWLSINAFPQAGGISVTTTTGNGDWYIDPTGYLQVRAEFTAYTSGTVTVAMEGSSGTHANSVTDGYGLIQTGPPLANSWSLTHTPTTGTQATASQAAGAAGVKHVCTSLSFGTWQNGTGAASAAGGLIFNLRDGATGAGTIKWSAIVSFPAVAFGQSGVYTVSGLNIVGTAATAMTIESAAAPAANSAAWVAASGYDTK